MARAMCYGGAAVEAACSWPAEQCVWWPSLLFTHRLLAVSLSVCCPGLRLGLYSPMKNLISSMQLQQQVSRDSRSIPGSLQPSSNSQDSTGSSSSSSQAGVSAKVLAGTASGALAAALLSPTELVKVSSRCTGAAAAAAVESSSQPQGGDLCSCRVGDLCRCLSWLKADGGCLCPASAGSLAAARQPLPQQQPGHCSSGQGGWSQGPLEGSNTRRGE